MRKCIYTFIKLSLVLVAMTACGSDNEIGTTAVAEEAVDVDEVVTSPVTIDGISGCTAVSSIDDFKSKVTTASFIFQNYHYEEYSYSECETDDKWYGTRTKCYTSFMRKSNIVLDELNHDLASTKEELHAELVSMVNAGSEFTRRSASSFYFLTDFGTVAAIDLCQPLAANPVYEGSGNLSYELSSVAGYYL